MLRRVYAGADSGEAGAAQVPGSAPELDTSSSVNKCFIMCKQRLCVFFSYLVEQACVACGRYQTPALHVSLRQVDRLSHSAMAAEAARVQLPT